jgi:hypothetical protein
MDWTKINLSNLASVPLNKKRELPAKEAIYFCVVGQEILYIGQSKNVNQRWRNHHRYYELVTREGVEIYWFECTGIKQRLIGERLLIEHYKPVFNSSPIRLKIALNDGTRLHTQNCVYLSSQIRQPIGLHYKLFDEMMNRFQLNANKTASAAKVSRVAFSRFRHGKTDLRAAKLVALIRALPPEAKIWYISELFGDTPNTSLQNFIIQASRDQLLEALHLIADSLASNNCQNQNFVELPSLL